MAKAVFAGEQIEKLSFVPTPAVLAATDAVITRLAKNFLVGDGPADAGYGNGQDKQFE
jgi:hypothetical protein